MCSFPERRATGVPGAPARHRRAELRVLCRICFATAGKRYVTADRAM
jgi:hypothetical protein